MKTRLFSYNDVYGVLFIRENKAELKYFNSDLGTIEDYEESPNEIDEILSQVQYWCDRCNIDLISY